MAVEIKKKRNYVDKNELVTALGIYTAKYREAEAVGDPRPEIPKYIGECIWNIAKGLSMRGNFSNYSFREDMVMDGVENCLLYMHNFDPAKTNNPFGYFTQIIWYAFLRRIAKEKKQMYIRYKSSIEMSSLGNTYEGESSLSASGVNLDYINGFVEEYESKLKKPPKKKTIKNEVSIESSIDQ